MVGGIEYLMVKGEMIYVAKDKVKHEFSSNTRFYKMPAISIMSTFPNFLVKFKQPSNIVNVYNLGLKLEKTPKTLDHA